jgi:hypothetical protein
VLRADAPANDNPLLHVFVGVWSTRKHPTISVCRLLEID